MALPPPAKRKRAPGAGRKPKGYVPLWKTTVPAGIPEAIADATLPGETIGETIARRFGWSPPPPASRAQTTTDPFDYSKTYCPPSELSE